MSHAKSFFWRSLILAILAFLVFGEVLSFSFLPYDDTATITANGYVNQGLTIDGVSWAFGYGNSERALKHDGVTNLWHPLTWVSHMLDVSLFGLESGWGHHLTGLGLHGLSALLLMLLAWRLLGSWNHAFLIAALWMVHPLKVESAAWISERKDVLSGAFFWASLLCIVGQKGEPRALWSKLGLAFFVLALLGKPSVVVLPLLGILLTGLQGEEKQSGNQWGWEFGKRSVLQYKWWFVISFVASVITVTMQLGGTQADTAGQSSLIDRLLPQAWAMGFYLWRFLIPLGLSIDYPQPNLPLAAILGSWVILLLSLALIWKFRSRFPTLFFASAWWCVCLLPVSGLFHVGTSFTSDRYLYLASAGPLLAAGIFLKGRIFPNWLTAVPALSLAALWSVLSFFQCQVWQDGWSLFTQVTRAQPESAMGWTNLGSMHLQAGDLSAAKLSFEAALLRNPQDHITWFNLGLVEHKSGDLNSAAKAYQNSLQANPSYLPSLKNLGITLFANGEYAEGLTTFQRACQISGYQRPELLLLACEASLTMSDLESAERYLDKLRKIPKQDPIFLRGAEKMNQLLENSR